MYVASLPSSLLPSFFSCVTEAEAASLRSTDIPLNFLLANHPLLSFIATLPHPTLTRALRQHGTPGLLRTRLALTEPRAWGGTKSYGEPGIEVGRCDWGSEEARSGKRDEPWEERTIYLVSVFLSFSRCRLLVVSRRVAHHRSDLVHFYRKVFLLIFDLTLKSFSTSTPSSTPPLPTNPSSNPSRSMASSSAISSGSCFETRKLSRVSKRSGPGMELSLEGREQRRKSKECRRRRRRVATLA